MINVMAGRFEQARNYAAERHLGLNQWRYIADAQHMRGLEKQAFVIVGSFLDRDDSQTMMREAKIQRWTLLQ